MAGVIQGLLFNFNLYLLTHFNGACSFRIEFMLSKNKLMERIKFCWSSWRSSDQSLSKFSITGYLIINMTGGKVGLKVQKSLYEKVSWRIYYH